MVKGAGMGAWVCSPLLAEYGAVSGANFSLSGNFSTPLHSLMHIKCEGDEIAGSCTPVYGLVTDAHAVRYRRDGGFHLPKCVVFCNVASRVPQQASFPVKASDPIETRAPTCILRASLQVCDHISGTREQKCTRADFVPWCAKNSMSVLSV